MTKILSENRSRGKYNFIYSIVQFIIAIPYCMFALTVIIGYLLLLFFVFQECLVPEQGS